ncbi:penicillin-binding protein 1A [Granulicella arctica]|uniref:Penicillin-binding protein 1A n=1 Tax=Granulicella arctica TaxID=940613 RepID=A0A7Y9PK25_9BACT|nr:PBP1A family penicillin-binding protein [Granulicella arctica]NYF81349.1 penicillin-binding protein 1A [Granulicella arctica]
MPVSSSRETRDPEVAAKPWRKWLSRIGRAVVIVCQWIAIVCKWIYVVCAPVAAWLFSFVDLRRLEFPSRRIAVRTTFLALLGLAAVLGITSGLMLVYSVDLPQMEDLVRYRPDTTTELYDIHGKVFGSFALERRVVVPYEQFPPVLREAIISIEDKSFESNWGVNLFRAVGAAWRDLHSKGRAQGASTLTMQLARNLFLSSEKTYGRKFQEILLSMQIERRFTKQQIFQLYANQIYLGHGTYGFEAGSEFYFSKHVRELTLPEAALLGGLPKGPEAYSPIRHPDKALRRRNLVLHEMLMDGKITSAQAAGAMAAPLGLHIATPVNSVAPYFVEEIRRQLEKEYGAEEVHGAGLRVYTTLDLDLQRAANKAVMDGLATYERRRGWKGHLQNVLASPDGLDGYQHPDWAQTLETGSYVHGVVTALTPRQVQLKVGTSQVVLQPEDWAWTQQWNAESLLKVGDVVYLKLGARLAENAGAEGFRAVLEQDSGAQASLMAVDNANGEVMAMVGGRDYALSQFNRATQAERQVGSSFKPYVYTAAIEAGSKPSDIILDAPTSFPTPSGWYTPHDYESGFAGTMTLTSAFAESRNIPALKLASQVGIRKVIETARRFGVTSNLPAYLPVAIGAADLTLYEQVGAYTVFPNDGIRIEPHYIRKLVQADGLPLKEKMPEVTEVISVDTARQMMVMLKAVVQYGTAATASALKHPLGGKTGTTNNYTDAWFVGFSPSVTCGTWIGFDDRESLGKKETGAKAALPIWIDFMRAAIADKPKEAFSTATAPKKVLDVDVPQRAPVVKPVAPKAEDTDSDDEDMPDSSGGDQPKVVAPTAGSSDDAPAAKVPQAAPQL